MTDSTQIIAELVGIATSAILVSFGIYLRVAVFNKQKKARISSATIEGVLFSAKIASDFESRRYAPKEHADFYNFKRKDKNYVLESAYVAEIEFFV